MQGWGYRKAKAQLELNLARDLKGIKYISSKRKTRECMGLLLNGNLITKDSQPISSILRLSLPQTLLVRQAFSNPRSMKLVCKSRAQ